ncbi:hypothetical protein ABZX12_18480 [Kribbella sp. NPDC003505]|uniref:hypothetical protein n=1 Tax=Kribbella sp. NPDC003505 TaxID=3154448 RepID=UPI0033BC6072
MPKRTPKVQVRPGIWAGQYIAWCYEPGCTWAMANSGKTYVEDRARTHRAEHRKAATGG